MRGALNIFAAPCYKLRIAPDRTAADGAFAVNMCEEIEGFCASRPFGFYNFDHSGNHFAGFFDHHGVTDTDVLAFDFILVVQGRTRNPAAAHRHRLEHRHRRENSGAPHLNDDVSQAGLDAFGRVFVCDRPARRFGGEAEPLALLKLIDFHDRAVGLICKIAPNFVQLADRVENFLDRIGQPPAFARG